jgi:hypothetical protein
LNRQNVRANELLTTIANRWKSQFAARIARASINRRIGRLIHVGSAGEFRYCHSCKKQAICAWHCDVCKRAGLDRFICSSRCRRIHLRDGRHRLEVKKAQRGAAGAAPPPDRRGLRVQVHIVRRGTSAAARAWLRRARRARQRDGR